MRFITRTIWVLSLVSLFTDVASEMLYPVMPIYLDSIGFSVVLIGMLEGLAEATAGLSKGYFGKLSDHTGRRVPFIRSGYAFSALSKPMMAAFVFPLWIFFARTLDRIGKGIRTGARDALLSQEALPGARGKVFGFHRAFDTLGAVLGPVMALAWLAFYPGNYHPLFLIAFFPGLLAIGLTYLLKEQRVTSGNLPGRVGFLSFLRYWRESSPAYRQVVAGLLVFALFNSSDVFLLLKAREAGAGDTTVIGVYVFYNLVYALTSFPAGILADKMGLKTVLLAGLLVFALVYTGMAFAANVLTIFCLFFLYGLYAAATEGISKAWITLLCDKADTATAIGTYTAFQSICTLLASSLAGVIWYHLGSKAAFLTSGLVTLAVACYFLLLTGDTRQKATAP